MEKEKADLIVLALYLGLPLAFLVVQYFIGGAIEKSHIRSLEAREAADADILLTNLETPPTVVGGCKPVLVAGEAVISSDFFKNWLFGFVSFFGGESRTFTRLFDRAPRSDPTDGRRGASCRLPCNLQRALQFGGCRRQFRHQRLVEEDIEARFLSGDRNGVLRAGK